MKIRSLLLIAATACAFSPLSAQSIEDIVDKARAYVGTEEALKAVHGIQFRGTIQLAQGEGEMAEGEVLLTFQKPFSQKIEFILSDRTLVTGFNGFEAFEYVEAKDPQGNPVRNTRSVGGDELRRNKAAAIENLSFYKPFRSLDSENTKDHGIVEVDGKKAHKIDFIHNGKFVFTRYFEIQSGDLLRSELDTGIVTIETGDLEASGVKFSKKIEGVMGDKTIYEMEFDQIIVNPEVEDTFFDYPL